MAVKHTMRRHYKSGTPLRTSCLLAQVKRRWVKEAYGWQCGGVGGTVVGVRMKMYGEGGKDGYLQYT